MSKRTLNIAGRTHSPRAILLLLTFLAGIVMAGCGGPRTYVHPMGVGTARRIAVIPLENLSTDGKAGNRVRTTFVIELLKTGSFEVIDTGEVDRLLEIASLTYGQNGIRTAVSIGLSKGAEEEEVVPLPPLSKMIGETLGVQAILVCSVDTYGSTRARGETVPEVTISARLIDAETGIIMWASTHTRRGSPGIPILGWGKRLSLGLVSRQVVEDMARDLAQYVYE